jgi:hypothetical protein
LGEAVQPASDPIVANPLDEHLDVGAVFVVVSGPDPSTQRLIVDELAGCRWGGQEPLLREAVGLLGLDKASESGWKSRAGAIPC